MLHLFCTMGLWKAGAPLIPPEPPLIPQLCLLKLTAP